MGWIVTRRLGLAMLGLGCLSASVEAQDVGNNQSAPAAAAPAADQGQTIGPLESKFSLMFGYDTLMQFRSRGVELDVEELCRGIRLAAAGEPNPVGREEAMLISQQFGAKVQACEQEMLKKQATANIRNGEAFLAQNAKEPGVQVLPSGVQYRVIQAGTGATPVAEDTVQVHYTGKLVDGTVFDSSAGGPPVSFPVSGVIRGMTECLKKMKVGEKCQMVIPSELAYGENAPDVIGPHQTLVFDVELVGIQPAR